MPPNDEDLPPPDGPEPSAIVGFVQRSEEGIWRGEFDREAGGEKNGRSREVDRIGLAVQRKDAVVTEGSSQGLVVVSEAIRRTIAKEVRDDKGSGNVVAVESTDGPSRRDSRFGDEVDGPREWMLVSCYHEDMVVLMQSECRWLLGPSAVLVLLRSI